MQPDDFETMSGVGYTYEKRLYDADVCTYGALAEATGGVH
jgi:predicted flap endonuclease-1-like 5' DNA nuclease